MTNENIADETRTLNNNVKAMKKESTTLAQKLKDITIHIESILGIN